LAHDSIVISRLASRRDLDSRHLAGAAENGRADGRIERRPIEVGCTAIGAMHVDAGGRAAAIANGHAAKGEGEPIGPLYDVHLDESWPHEGAIIDIVGKYIAKLPHGAGGAASMWRR